MARRLSGFACVLLVLGHAGVAAADQVKLADGGTVQGKVRQEGSQVIVELDSGELRLAAADVVEIKAERSALHECDERRAALAAHDVTGRIELAQFCESQGLPLKARALWQEVLRFDPDNALARKALGFVRDGDRWLTRDEQAQRDGKVKYQGQWLDARTVAEIEQAHAAAAVAQEQRKQAEHERERAELELRTAREKAEAERKQAEAQQELAEQQNDYAYWGYGGWGYGYPGWWNGRPPCVRRPGVQCPGAPGQAPGPRPHPYRPNYGPFPIAGVKDPRSY